jgi:hypothetical protein
MQFIELLNRNLNFPATVRTSGGVSIKAIRTFQRLEPSIVNRKVVADKVHISKCESGTSPFSGC